MTDVNRQDAKDAKRKLPDGWRWVRLGEAIRETQLGFACGQRDPNGTVQLRMNNITDRGGFDWSTITRVPADPETIQMYRLQLGDVLFNNTNSTDLVGKAAIFKGFDEPVVFSNHFTRLRTLDDLLSPSFLALWLRKQWQDRLFANICNRWIGQSAVQRDKLLALKIPLPPLPEQQRIAAILNEQMAAVERARAAAEARLEAAKALRAAYIRVVFKGTVACHWAITRLADLILEARNGIYKPDEFYGSGVPILKMFNIGRLDGSWQLDRVDRVQLTSDEADIYRLRVGDILFNRVNSRELVGKCALVNGHTEGAVFESKNMRVRLNTAAIDPAYATIFLNSEGGRKQIEDKLKQIVGQATVNRTDLNDIHIPLPAVNEQQRIVAILSQQVAEAERVRKAVTEELSALNALPAALLRRAISGEI